MTTLIKSQAIKALAKANATATPSNEALVKLGAEYKEAFSGLVRSTVRVCNILAEVHDLTKGIEGGFKAWCLEYAGLNERQAARYVQVSRDPEAVAALEFMGLSTTLDYINGSPASRKLINAMIAKLKAEGSNKKITKQMVADIQTTLAGETVKPKVDAKVEAAVTEVKKVEAAKMDKIKETMKAEAERFKAETTDLKAKCKEATKAAKDKDTKIAALEAEVARLKAIEVEYNKLLAAAKKPAKAKKAAPVKADKPAKAPKAPKAPKVTLEKAVEVFAGEWEQMNLENPLNINKNRISAAEVAGFTVTTEGKVTTFTLDKVTLTTKELSEKALNLM